MPANVWHKFTTDPCPSATRPVNIGLKKENIFDYCSFEFFHSVRVSSLSMLIWTHWNESRAKINVIEDHPTEESNKFDYVLL